ncbi:GPR endopeptidase [Clostridium sp. SHJSY1]|uniref:GPR endopeptidase n=1 Tax=Clostridium sp. SHJSY1 TaxID=2942483 RepID=UPI0028746345|nr:GPR endopeptidase [Clostridium sp. SHJSY1]MDS0524070.1 GPR endopeptidase [Clostridium sp. SHJSY1]
MINVRTDLAVEAREIYKQENKKDADGVIVEEYEDEGTQITKVKIMTEDGAIKMGKPIGNYITLEIPEFTVYDGELMDDVSIALGKTLKKIINMNENKLALVVGLGNRKVTPDALGPKVTEGIMVTRHLKSIMPDTIDDSISPVAAIAPGVLGITGIETGEVIKGIVERIKPDVVICIDALASRKIERVNRTIQISDTGISPGAGVGNHRMQINEKTLGVKVIAIGVPTVVDAATIANDTIDLVLDDLIKQSEEGKDFYKMLKKLDKQEKSILIKEVLDPFVGDLVVTPKEVDLMIDSLSKIIANGINIAVQPSMTVEDINKFLN